MSRYWLDETFATVGAEEDIDGACLNVVLTTDRREDYEGVVIEMTPATARALARRLNRWARLVSTPVKGRR